ncbi:hypothetical protein ANN_08850 [Periplaneta americana]|uniref:Uncharacterized protein n=1 Tax=Periplaneta americana TaxID=6978 RepID=A0ABQ8T479_PERAM|nr:hypothetical protein ANN_08850 [Periplaneta americana]
MGARQSKRSVDITTTPKKEGAEEQQQSLDGRLGHIEEGSGDIKPAANGAPSHSATDIQQSVLFKMGKSKELSAELKKTIVRLALKVHVNYEQEFWDSDETKINLFGSDGAHGVWKKKNEADKVDNNLPTVKHGGGVIMIWWHKSSKGEEVMHNGSEQIVDGEIESAHTPEMESATAEEKEKSVGEDTNADNKAKKEKKDKVKKKWSFRSISFSKKDKSKPPPREDKNGDVTKEEVAEGEPWCYSEMMPFSAFLLDVGKLRPLLHDRYLMTNDHGFDTPCRTRLYQVRMGSLDLALSSFYFFFFFFFCLTS